jgi:hypothetical protein
MDKLTFYCGLNLRRRRYKMNLGKGIALGSVWIAMAICSFNVEDIAIAVISGAAVIATLIIALVD